jgi:hypothetical protein
VTSFSRAARGDSLGPGERTQKKSQRQATEDKIRIPREAEAGFHCWGPQFGRREVNDARQLKELERQNAVLKKMLAGSLLKNRGEGRVRKNSKPKAVTGAGAEPSSGGRLLRAGGWTKAAGCRLACRRSRRCIRLNRQRQIDLHG